MSIASNSARRGPIASSRSAAPSNSPAAGSASPAGTKSSRTPRREQAVEHLVEMGAVADSRAER